MNDQSALFAEAMGIFAAGKLKDAETSFSKLIALEPNNSEVFHMLGVVALKTNRLELAHDQIVKAISINGGLAGYYVNLALVLRRLNRNDEAAVNYKKAIELSPDLLAAHHGLFITLTTIVPSWHVPMMNESSRNNAYYQALESAIVPGSTVFEIGTGGGLLALISAKLGALVTTCEMRPWLADTARQIISDNNYQDRITVLQGHSMSVSISPVDILVSEIFSSELLGEGVLTSIEDAKRRLLKPNGKVIPAVGSVMIALVGGSDLRKNLLVENSFEFNLQFFNSRLPQKRFVFRDDLEPKLLSNPVEAFRFDFQNNSLFPAEVKIIEINVTSEDECFGIIQWIRFETGDAIYENSPEKKSKILGWKQCVHLFKKPSNLKLGQKVSVKAIHNRVNLLFSQEN